MKTDLTGGLRPEQDLMLGAAPEDPEMRQGVSMWISLDDPARGLGFPRLGLEAVASEWDRPRHMFQAAWTDGRVVLVAAPGALARGDGPAGRSTVWSSGPFEVRCHEPFRRWTVHYEGTAIDTTVQDQVAGTVDPGRSVDVSFHLECDMAVPPFVQGTLGREARGRMSGDSVEAAFMGGVGGFRFEQLFRGEGSFRAGGGSEQTFSCTGLRILRQGVRDTRGFWGHCWQSALFPSGRAFGYIAYPPRPDGSPSYSEGFVFDGAGELVPAMLVEAPWMTDFVPLGGKVPLVLESERGTATIAAETFVSLVHRQLPDFPPVHQGCVQYMWDGEVAYGMIERSYPADQISW